MDIYGTINHPYVDGVNVIVEWTGIQNAQDNTTTLQLKYYVETTQPKTTVKFESNFYSIFVCDEAIGKFFTSFNARTVVAEEAGIYPISALITASPLKHNVDGTISNEIKLQSGNAGGVTITIDGVDKSISYGVFTKPLEITAINRASEVSCAETWIGETAKIVINPIIAKAKHELFYSFCGETGSIYANWFSEEDNGLIDWTLPTDFYKAMNGASEAECTITCNTYDIDAYGEDYSTSVANPLFLCGTTTTTFTIKADVRQLGPSITVLDTAPDNGFNQYWDTVSVYYRAKANPYTDANLMKIVITCGTQQKVLTPENTTLEETMGLSYLETTVFNYADSGKITLEAWDELGLASRTVVDIPMITYTKLTCNLETHTVSIEDGTTSFTISGNYNGDILANNVQNELTLTYSVESSDDTTFTDRIDVAVTPDISGNYYSATINLTGLDYRYRYRISVNVRDLLSVNYAESTIISVPLFDWHATSFRHNTRVTNRKGLILSNNQPIYGATKQTSEYGYGYVEDMPNSTGHRELMKINDADELEIGDANAVTKINGSQIDLLTSGIATLNGMEIGTQKLLWTGSELMGADASIVLSENISNQLNGIVLLFARYNGSYVFYEAFNSFFVSKAVVDLTDSYSNPYHNFMMALDLDVSAMACKRLNIYGNRIEGHENNTKSGTHCGITYNNNNYVLVGVIGV